MKSGKSKGTENKSLAGNNWILGIFIIIILVIVIIIFNTNFNNLNTYNSNIENFTDLKINILDASGQKETKKVSELTKWNGDNYQQIQLNFTNSQERIVKVRLEFKDIENNNIYTYSAEDNTQTNTQQPFKFSLNLPPKRRFVVYIYLNNNKSAPTFTTNLDSNDYYFNFTDINGNVFAFNSSDPSLQCTIFNPDTGMSYKSNGVDLGTLKMQSFNLVSIPINLPNINEFKNKLRVINSTDPVIKAEHDAKISVLDQFVFKEIQANLVILNIPPSISITADTGSSKTQAGDFDSTGISPNDIQRLVNRYPNAYKVLTPGPVDCNGKNKCSIHVKNVINGVKYRLEIRAVYQQLGTVEPNIRYTATQKILFNVSNASNTNADLNEAIKIADIGRQYKLTREQKDFIATDQNRQDAVLRSIESDINSLGSKVYNNIDRRI